MLVKDIYGDHPPLGLPADLLASSFAKVAFNETIHFDTGSSGLSEQMNGFEKCNYKKEDILSSLVFMISFNIGQLTSLTASLHDVKKIYFIGNYVRE